MVFERIAKSLRMYLEPLLEVLKSNGFFCGEAFFWRPLTRLQPLLRA